MEVQLRYLRVEAMVLECEGQVGFVNGLKEDVVARQRVSAFMKVAVAVVLFSSRSRGGRKWIAPAFDGCWCGVMPSFLTDVAESASPTTSECFRKVTATLMP